MCFVFLLSGRILNRFTKDIGIIDGIIPIPIQDFIFVIYVIEYIVLYRRAQLAYLLQAYQLSSLMCYSKSYF